VLEYVDEQQKHEIMEKKRENQEGCKGERTYPTRTIQSKKAISGWADELVSETKILALFLGGRLPGHTGGRERRDSHKEMVRGGSTSADKTAIKY